MPIKRRGTSFIPVCACATCTAVVTVHKWAESSGALPTISRMDTVAAVAVGEVAVGEVAVMAVAAAAAVTIVVVVTAVDTTKVVAAGEAGEVEAEAAEENKCETCSKGSSLTSSSTMMAGTTTVVVAAAVAAVAAAATTTTMASMTKITMDRASKTTTTTTKATTMQAGAGGHAASIDSHTTCSNVLIQDRTGSKGGKGGGCYEVPCPPNLPCSKAMAGKGNASPVTQAALWLTIQVTDGARNARSCILALL